MTGNGSQYGAARLLLEDEPGGAYRAAGLLTGVLNEQFDALTFGIDGHYLSEDGKFKADAQAFTSDKDGLERGYGGFIDFEPFLDEASRNGWGSSTLMTKSM